MKKIFLLFFFVVSAFSPFYAQNNQEKTAAQKTRQERKIESIWEGKLSIQSVSLRLAVKIYKKDDGLIGGFLDSPDQGIKDIPISSISMTEDSLKFTITAIRASYAGKLDKTAMTFVGVFKQANNELPLELKKVEKVTEVIRPQNPVKPYPYNEEEVAFENKKANIILAGTFTFPSRGNNFPVVVLVTGSGPQDRDETLLNHKPFLVISDYLTRNGFAVLRYDDRGIGKSKGNFARSTTEDFAGDALAAVEYLKTRKEINKKKIGIMGHSEGGIIAPMCAARSKDVAFIVLLAGPGVPGKEIIMRQAELIARAQGEKEENITKALTINKMLYDIVVSTSDSSLAAFKLNQAIDNFTASLSDEEKKNSEFKKEAMAAGIKQILTPWFRFFIKYDPRQDLVKLKIPVLALNGERDLQVDPKQNLPEIKKALNKAGNKKFKTIEIPGLNHLFQTVNKGTISEYGELEETFSPKALEIIKEWLIKI